VNPLDMQLLERWLALIARFRERGWISEDEATDLRRKALEAIT
jgi:hypothetical protein